MKSKNMPFLPNISVSLYGFGALAGMTNCVIGVTIVIRYVAIIQPESYNRGFDV